MCLCILDPLICLSKAECFVVLVIMKHWFFRGFTNALLAFAHTRYSRGAYWPIVLFFQKKNYLEDISPFRGATDTPVLNFWWRLPWVSRPGWIPHLCALLPACNEFLRFISGATPANCIEVSMAAEPFWSMYLQTCSQALVEVQGLPQARHCRPLGHTGSAIVLLIMVPTSSSWGII